MKLTSFLKSFTLGTLSVLLTSLPMKAAEKIHFIYGPLILSLKVDSLALFAEEGIINKELAFYLNAAGLNEEQKENFRQALLKKAEIDPLILSRLLRTPTGEKLLERLGILVAVRGGRNGKYVLRGSLVQSAFDQEEGLTLLNFLRNLSTDVQLNLGKVERFANYVSTLENATGEIVDKMETLAKNDGNQLDNIDFSQLPNIREPGSYGVAPVQTWELTDNNRSEKRKFQVLVVTPKTWRKGQTPVVVMSHGLNSQPKAYLDRAKHLASYGYVVALPDHVGSNGQYFQDMLEGYHRQMYSVNEFIDRPLDISYVLDELERRNDSDFEGRLNLQRVGVLGHSFGGYTALALAGAPINFDNLEEICNRRVWEPNVSLLLQCRALELPRQDYNFRDERIQAIISMNPVNSAIFGEQSIAQLNIPVAFGAGSDDPATPAAIEQLKSFVWLQPTDKYLGLVVGQAHLLDFNKLDTASEALIDLFPEFTIPDQSLMDEYGNAFVLAFNEAYLAQNKEYMPYLTSAFGNYISGDSNPIYFVNSSAEVPLGELYNELRPKELPAIYPPER